MALHRAELYFGLSHIASSGVLILTVLDFLVVGGIFALKALRHFDKVIEEWHHPVKLAFFPAISLSLMLIGTASRHIVPGLAEAIWLGGTALQAVLTLAVISSWVGHRAFQPAQITPAWFIPAVGNVIVPVAGVGFGYVEISWMFFSLGMLFWIVLLTLVINRLIFHDPLPAKLLPTLVILIAPPAIAFSSWLQLSGQGLDPFARILFYSALSLAAIVAIQARGFAKLPFALSWWALSFPVAALTIATFSYAEATGLAFFSGLALVFLAVLLAIMIGLVARTLMGLLRDELCHPD